MSAGQESVSPKTSTGAMKELEEGWLGSCLFFLFRWISGAEDGANCILSSQHEHITDRQKAFFFFFFFFLTFIEACVCCGVCMKVRGQLPKLVLSSHRVGPGNQTQVLSLGCKYFYLLSCFHTPKPCSNFEHFLLCTFFLPILPLLQP